MKVLVANSLAGSGHGPHPETSCCVGRICCEANGTTVAATRLLGRPMRSTGAPRSRSFTAFGPAIAAARNNSPSSMQAVQVN